MSRGTHWEVLGPRRKNLNDFQRVVWMAMRPCRNPRRSFRFPRFRFTSYYSTGVLFRLACLCSRENGVCPTLLKATILNT